MVAEKVKMMEAELVMVDLAAIAVTTTPSVAAVSLLLRTVPVRTAISRALVVQKMRLKLMELLLPKRSAAGRAQ